MALSTPAALAYRFFPRTGPEAPAAQAALESAWTAIGDRLGCSSSVAALDVPFELPEDWAHHGGSRLVAAAEDPENPGIVQAWVRVEHEVCALLVMVAPSGGDVTVAWGDLGRRLDDALGPPGAALGETRVFLALADGAATGADSAPDDVVAAAPGTPAMGWRWRTDAIALPRRAREPATAWLWELTAGAEDRVLRALVLVAPTDAEAELDQLVWTTGDGSLTPLGRHLMHAAVLRYELRVFEDGRSSGGVRAELDEIEETLAVTASADVAEARLPSAAASLAALGARTKRLAEAVTITRDNLLGALGTRLHPTPGSGPASADRGLADWFLGRIEEDRARLQVANEEAGRLSVLFTAAWSSSRSGSQARPAAADKIGVSAFICYIHDSDAHKENVLRFAEFLRANGINADLDQWVGTVRQDWYVWALQQIQSVEFVLVIASPQCRVVGDGAAPSDRNRGGQSELAALRDLLQKDRRTWTRKILPVILPGGDIDGIPLFLQPYAADHYSIDDYSVAGVESLLRALTGRSARPKPPLGPEGAPPPHEPEVVTDLRASAATPRLAPSPKTQAPPATSAADEIDRADTGSSVPDANSIPASPAGFVRTSPSAAQPVTYTGSGNRVLTIAKPESGPVLMTTTNRGPEQNFTVSALDTDLIERDLLVNAIGSYNGRSILDRNSGDDTRWLKISGGGTWQIVLDPLTAARPMTRSIAGTGDDVIWYRGPVGVATVSNNGPDENFTVFFYGKDGEELLMNEIGSYEGETTIKEGPAFLEIDGAGSWSIEVAP